MKEDIEDAEEAGQDPATIVDDGKLGKTLSCTISYPNVQCHSVNSAPGACVIRTCASVFQWGLLSLLLYKTNSRLHVGITL